MNNKISILGNHEFKEYILFHINCKHSKYECVGWYDSPIKFLDELKNFAQEVDLVLIEKMSPTIKEIIGYLGQNYPHIHLLVMDSLAIELPLDTSNVNQSAPDVVQQYNNVLNFLLEQAIKSRQTTNEHESNSDEKNKAKMLSPFDLSNTELELLQLMKEDITYEEIAHYMNKSPHTIETLRYKIFKKFNVKSRTAIVIAAYRMKIISL